MGTDGTGWKRMVNGWKRMVTDSNERLLRPVSTRYQSLPSVTSPSVAVRGGLFVAAAVRADRAVTDEDRKQRQQDTTQHSEQSVDP